MTNKIRLLFCIIVCFQPCIIAFGDYKPELFDQDSENYLFREPDPIDNPIQIKASYDRLLNFIQSINLILRTQTINKLTWDLNSVFESSSQKPKTSSKLTKEFQSALRYLKLESVSCSHETNPNDTASLIAKSLSEIVVWELINEKITRSLQAVAEEKIRPFIWDQLKSDVMSQINYHLACQKRMDNTVPQWIHTDLIVGDYKIIRVSETTDHYEQKLKYLTEEASMRQASKVLKSSILKEIGDSNRVDLQARLNQYWLRLPPNTHKWLREQLLVLFSKIKLSPEPDFRFFNINWDAYHGQLSGDIDQLIGYTHMICTWMGLILLQSEELQELQQQLHEFILEAHTTIPTNITEFSGVLPSMLSSISL